MRPWHGIPHRATAESLPRCRSPMGEKITSFGITGSDRYRPNARSDPPSRPRPQPERRHRRLRLPLSRTVVRQQLSRRYVALARLQADAEAPQRPSLGNVPPHVVGVGASGLIPQVKPPAHRAHIQACQQQVARPRAEVEAQAASGEVPGGHRLAVPVVDVQADPPAGGRVAGRGERLRLAVYVPEVLG